MRHYVGAPHARLVHDLKGFLKKKLTAERAFEASGAPRCGQAKAKRLVAGNRRQERREYIGGTAEAVDHHDRLAVTLDFESDALDVRHLRPASSSGAADLRRASQKAVSDYTR